MEAETGKENLHWSYGEVRTSGPTVVTVKVVRLGQNCDVFIFSLFLKNLLEYSWEMATHSSVLAWRISGTGALGGLPSMASHRVRHD